MAMTYDKPTFILTVVNCIFLIIILIVVGVTAYYAYPIYQDYEAFVASFRNFKNNAREIINQAKATRDEFKNIKKDIVDQIKSSKQEIKQEIKQRIMNNINSSPGAAVAAINDKKFKFQQAAMDKIKNIETKLSLSNNLSPTPESFVISNSNKLNVYNKREKYYP